MKDFADRIIEILSKHSEVFDEANLFLSGSLVPPDQESSYRQIERAIFGRASCISAYSKMDVYNSVEAELVKSALLAVAWGYATIKRRNEGRDISSMSIAQSEVPAMQQRVIEHRQLCNTCIQVLKDMKGAKSA